MNRSLTALVTVTAAAPACATTATPAEVGAAILSLTLVALLLSVWLLHRFSAAVVLRLFRACPLDSRVHSDLHRLNRQLALNAGLQPPRLFLVESETANAFATGRDGCDATIALTRGLLRLLDHQELAGVLAHELAHLRQRNEAGFFYTMALSGSASLLAGFVRSVLVFSAGRRGAAFSLVTAPLAAIAAILGRRATLGSREFVADAMGARICGNPRWLANALRKIRATEYSNCAVPCLLSTELVVAERIHRLEALAYGAYV